MIALIFQIATGLAIVLALVSAFVLVFGNLIPVATIAASIATASTYLSAVYMFMPVTVTTLLFLFLALLSIETAIGTYKVVKWVYQKFPSIT